MPCRSDHMEPNDREVEMSRVFTLIDELDGKKFSKGYYEGYHPRAYNLSISQDLLDKSTATLCMRLTDIEKKGNITDYSLELQTWWRDHQESDKRHDAEDKEEKRLARLRKAAAKRLTKNQRDALGIDENGDRKEYSWV